MSHDTEEPAKYEDTDPTTKDYNNLDFTSFDDFLFEFHEGNLIKGIYAYGFEKPSPIQAKTIVPICDGVDIIAQARSGSGKTGAFVIGTLARVNIEEQFIQAVIIANTKELASQIFHVFKNIGNSINVKLSLCVGGSDTSSNLKEAYESHILICTPGRLFGLIEKDMFRKPKIRMLDRLKLLIIDEADLLLGKNFIEQTKNIITNIPKKTQICLFSATYAREALELTREFMNKPIKILIEAEKISVEAIKNYYINVGEEDNKYSIILDFYQKISVCQAVIFVNSIEKGVDLAEKLVNNGYPVGLLHSKLEDEKRLDVLKKFRLTQTRILIATDLISRGIDVQQVGLVINYDVPGKIEQYIHRVGRSGRYGKLGVAITFVTDDNYDVEKMKNIQKIYKINFEELPTLDNVNKYLTGSNGF
jgi:translation initiation factor 4A